MPEQVVLEYPGGRRRDEEIETVVPLEVGSEFELLGRTWRVVQLLPPNTWHRAARWRCAPLSAGPFEQPGS